MRLVLSKLSTKCLFSESIQSNDLSKNVYQNCEIFALFLINWLLSDFYFKGNNQTQYESLKKNKCDKGLS